MRKLLKSTIGAMAVGLGMMMVVGCQNPNNLPEVPTYTVTLETPFEEGKTFTGKVGDALPTEDEMNNTIDDNLKFGQWYTYFGEEKEDLKIYDRALLGDYETNWESDLGESGITFAGWYDGNTKVEKVTPEHKTLIAKWTVTISYCSLLNDGSYTIGGFTSPENPENPDRLIFTYGELSIAVSVTFDKDENPTVENPTTIELKQRRTNPNDQPTASDIILC